MSTLTDRQLIQYQHEGFMLLESLFSGAEIEALREKAVGDREMDRHAYGRGDGEGGEIRLSLWNYPGNGIYGAIARSQRMYDVTRAILQDEPYHYHSKMIMKDALTGGAWAWHQDYGYWYQNAVLRPNLVSAFIAVDAANRQNGCLQVIPRSHHYGRIDHTLTGEQAGADLERVSVIQDREGIRWIEMNPGDVLFFHPNLLHRSDQNRSESPRWSMICCYNSRSNEPYKESRHPGYYPLHVIADEKVLNYADEEATEMNWHTGSTPTADSLSSDQE